MAVIRITMQRSASGYWMMTRFTVDDNTDTELIDMDYGHHRWMSTGAFENLNRRRLQRVERVLGG